MNLNKFHKKQSHELQALRLSYKKNIYIDLQKIRQSQIFVKK